ncbi:DNA translocase FtsK [Cytobacillus massiliigabonensis]|uniref:DNA translocase FtsK n=1 Tax=Cytobacillus massiliigabonensis TaxID=1871011 RepID=UPI000C82B4E1|nr:DNA translocase FtsK [Cytobacillus massiliigabonensis]
MPFNKNTEEENFLIAKDTVIRMQAASVSMIQRRLRIGYMSAARIMDRLEGEGVVSPYVDGVPRTVLIKETKE